MRVLGGLTSRGYRVAGSRRREGRADLRVAQELLDLFRSRRVKRRWLAGVANTIKGMTHAAKSTSSEAERRRAAAKRLRGLFADVAPDRSLVDEMIADRRVKAQTEGGEDARSDR